MMELRTGSPRAVSQSRPDVANVTGAHIPSRSQITDWDVRHLESANSHWSATAQRWEEHFTTLHTATLSPGGTVWEGTSADAAQDRAWSDLVKVRGLTDCLLNAATSARNGADDIRWAKQRALDAITEAEQAGFTIGEDLSVTDRTWTPLMRGWEARQTKADEFATNIRAQAQNLEAADNMAAGRITAALSPLEAVQFSESPNDGTVHALDLKESPAPSPRYPINEVIAEATDLDGNHVVMRRGYYDAVTKKGFGWDKVYWRHGVVNPNVFKDLISHSRPVKNDGGTLVYDVPINRAHCTSGPLGWVSCDDTGESVTMRIVVNTNANADIPDGSQKGLITMYPLAGGSGVVEIGPNWTWTPPWVNNNVPIN